MARKKKTVTPEEINKETPETVENNEKVGDGSSETETPADEAVTDVATEAVDDGSAETETPADDAVTDAATEAVDDGASESETTTDEVVTEAAAEEVDDGASESETPTDDTSEDDSLPEFMNIEHFADYRRKDEVEDASVEEDTVDDEIESGEETDEGEVIDGEESEFREYENLTILDELEDEPEAPLPVSAKKASKDEMPYDEKKPRGVDARFDFIELFVWMMAIIMLLSAFVFRHSVVDGGSMESTLYNGEHLIISNFFYEPKQYDIVVCEDYSTGLKKPIIKRIIATEGQTVRVVAMDEVYVDGELIDTSFILVDGEEELIMQNVYPIECVVPEGEVFVMGDHRNNSLDSRLLGTIDEDTILGKVVLRFYPFDRFGKVE